ncbi:MAG: exopolyphosphatase [Lachnospiraceae bacterium]|nr:exopolyphosphatase [Lachnospiraceae bacterium]
MANKTFAAIDVGSFELMLRIYEFSGKGEAREIDTLVKRLALGNDTYASGKISNEKVDELCRVLRDFSSIMKSYKVSSYKAYGTSAIRESKNYTVLLDQIEQRTGIRVELLSNSEQRYLDYKSVAYKGAVFNRVIEESSAILDIGGGSIQISLFDKDTLVSTQNLRLGVLRIQERLRDFHADLARMDALIDEMVSAQLSTYKKLYLHGKNVKNIIIVDDYISPLMVRGATDRKFGAEMDRDEFRRLRKILTSHSEYQTAMSMEIPEEKIPLLLISVVLTDRIAEMMDSKSIWAPGVTLCDGIAYEYMEEKHLLSERHDFEKDIIACAFNISKRYMGSRSRAETLRTIAGTIFESTKSLHGLGKRERLYLDIATILHDCGRYISLTNLGERSYDIVMNTEIIGLSHQEREIVANIIKFNHSEFVYYAPGGDNGGLDRESYLVVAKLTAILRLANTLDRSHKKKMVEVKASLKENELILSVDTPDHMLLEQAYFDETADFFQEVYSVRPVLKLRKTL